ncbi:hypothetical protein HYPSUDRAFT_76808 [Hypholoma sublateritium FD-334 SS-4]|uniref:Uncharacterized protein n=1 Tax=Hypholoma sublateritium (strain FD-334 SS-4) TaxID=945553 RepID=A0A0D2PW53_HYPSF|nr:hypothetical protein HYPSUDRAFT_76808 [Hypholoma sublateritium FD-334 SS-4]
MLFNFAAVLVAATSIAASAVPFRRQASNEVTCSLVVGPETPVTTCTNLAAEFNLLIARNLGTDAGGGVVNIDNGGAMFLPNANGTFSVQETFSDSVLTAAQTAAIIEGWVGEVKGGSTMDWIVEAASCT